MSVLETTQGGRGHQAARRPLFSVIIPSYNRCQLVREAIDSVLAQTEQDFELIVVDDGSADETALMLRELYSERLILVEQANQGPAAARNTGAKHAGGEYLAFLDSDDLWMRWTLATYRSAIEEFARPCVITSVPFECAMDADIQLGQSLEQRFMEFRDYFSSHRRPRAFGSGLTVVQRATFLDVQGYSTHFTNAEDLDFMLRVGDAAGFVEIDHPRVVVWRRHENNLTSNVVATGDGLSRILAREQMEEYPGGKNRRWERRRIIARHVRPHSLAALKVGHWRNGLVFYSETFLWNLCEGRIRYLFGFPFLVAMKAPQTLWQRLAKSRRQQQQHPPQRIEL